MSKFRERIEHLQETLLHGLEQTAELTQDISSRDLLAYIQLEELHRLRTANTGSDLQARDSICQFIITGLLPEASEDIYSIKEFLTHFYTERFCTLYPKKYSYRQFLLLTSAYLFDLEIYITEKIERTRTAQEDPDDWTELLLLVQLTSKCAYMMYRAIPIDRKSDQDENPQG